MLFFKKNLILLFFLNFLSPLYGSNDYRDNNYFSTYIEAVAKSKLGISYKWGGNGPFCYDCSGFTKEVFEENGIVIPRISKEQAKIGKKVGKNQLKKGDLIFFHSKNKTAVDHVGIYLGGGEFIHASRFHKRIVISPFREYKQFFKWGRRLE